MTETIARIRRGTNTIMGTDFPVENVVEKIGPRKWRVTIGLCNGVPAYAIDFRTRSGALQAAGADTTFMS